MTSDRADLRCDVGPSVGAHLRLRREHDAADRSVAAARIRLDLLCSPCDAQVVVESRLPVQQRRPSEPFHLTPGSPHVREPEDERLRIERLDDIVPGARAESGDVLRAGGVRRDDDDRYHDADRTRLAQCDAEVDRVGIVEVVADHDDIGRRLVDELERSQPGACAHDPPPGGVENGGDRARKPAESLGNEQTERPLPGGVAGHAVGILRDGSAPGVAVDHGGGGEPACLRPVGHRLREHSTDIPSAGEGPARGRPCAESPRELCPVSSLASNFVGNGERHHRFPVDRSNRLTTVCPGRRRFHCRKSAASVAAPRRPPGT
jgi:hypothetical protein